MGALVAFALLTSASASAAQEILVVRTSNLAPYRAVEAAFAASIGRAVRTIDVAENAAALDPAIADNPPLVFAIGPGALRAVAQARSAAKVVYALAPNADSIAGGALRGVPMFAPMSRQATLLRQLLPRAKRVGVLVDPTRSSGLLSECKEAAAANGFSVVVASVGNKREVAAKARELIGAVDAIWLVPDSTVVSLQTLQFIMQTSLEFKVPVVGFMESMAKAGAVLAIEAEYADMGRKAAALARRVLAGENAGSDPLDGTIYLNAKSAAYLDVPLPSALRSQARRVFE